MDHSKKIIKYKTLTGKVLTFRGTRARFLKKHGIINQTYNTAKRSKREVNDGAFLVTTKEGKKLIILEDRDVDTL